MIRLWSHAAVALGALGACGGHKAPTSDIAPITDEPWRGLPAEPWLNAPNSSEQFFPRYVGATPREIVLDRPRPTRPRLPLALRALAEEQMPKIVSTLDVSGAQLQAWPTEDWNGQPNWVFARYRTSPASPWQWLSQTSNWRPHFSQVVGRRPLLPDKRDPGTSDHHKFLFADFLEYASLYQMPQFGNCVYERRLTRTLVAAWPPAHERDRLAATLRRIDDVDAYCMNAPARFNGEPYVVTLTTDASGIAWPEDIEWLPAYAADQPVASRPLELKAWPTHFVTNYEDDVAMIAGDADAQYPLSRTTRRFVKKGSFQPDHDLEHLVDYLEERYRALGIPTVRQRFVWRGIPQSNLIAKIQGRTQAAPVIMADHIDTAVEEDTFARTRARVTTKGAADNATGTAALLGAAAALKDSRPLREIWLVHLTGEEFPAVDLGARHFLTELMTARQDIYATVITDFIGYHRPGEPMFQVSPTSVPGSERMAALALDASRRIAPSYTARYQPRDNERNSVFQTDLHVFESYGFAGVLFNENMNYANPSEASPHYHQSTDVVANINFEFSSTIAKVAIETVLRLANEPDGD